MNKVNFDNQDIEANALADFEYCRDNFIDIWKMGATAALVALKYLICDEFPEIDMLIEALNETMDRAALDASNQHLSSIQEAARLLELINTYKLK